ncbi:MAG TPA: 5-oxoprolinase subunit PxpA [Phnomibacter sp.]|nr:5-oxoprolinase subunit PxpA [Phnomibacter sp.]
MQKSIDLNCDLGEGMPTDAAIIPYISSANISCGFHAGDEDTMANTIRLCLQHGVAIGAHPSFNDRENFGRTAMHLPANAIEELVLQQLSIMADQCAKQDAIMHHVKPHGALYNMSAADENIAAAIANAILQFNPNLVLFGLAGSISLSVAKQMGIRVVHEFFADRTYQPNGSLTPRTQANATLHDVNDAVEQAMLIATDAAVRSVDGALIYPCGQQETVSICLHGDGENAIEFAQAIHQKFQSNHIHIKPSA